MNIEHLQTIYNNNIDSIFTPERFKEIALHKSNIQGYSFLNRVLIHLQNKYCTNVKSEESWGLAGRIIKDKAIPMGTVNTVKKVRYIECDTGKEVSLNDLSNDEFSKAIEIGIINKEIIDESVRVSLVYDIRDTIEIDGDADKNTRKIKISSLFKLLNSIGIDVEKTDALNSTYDAESDTFLIGRDNLDNKIKNILIAFGNKYIRHIEDSVELENDIKNMLVNYIVLAGMSYYNMECDIEFENIQSIYENYIDKLWIITNILDDIESILYTSIFSLEQNNVVNGTEEYKINVANKAAALLNILEANYKINYMKGE